MHENVNKKNEMHREASLIGLESNRWPLNRNRIESWGAPPLRWSSSRLHQVTDCSSPSCLSNYVFKSNTHLICPCNVQFIARFTSTTEKAHSLLLILNNLCWISHMIADKACVQYKESSKSPTVSPNSSVYPILAVVFWQLQSTVCAASKTSHHLPVSQEFSIIVAITVYNREAVQYAAEILSCWHIQIVR